MYIKPYILILLSLINSIAMGDNIKMNARWVNKDISVVVLKLKNLTYQKGKESYLIDITAKINEETIYNISTGILIAKNPVFRFKFKNNINNNQIKLYITNNHGEQKQGTIKLNSKYNWINMVPTEYNLSNNTILTNPKLWKIPEPEQVIKKLYGSSSVSKSISEKINIKAITYSESYSRIPIKISSDVLLKSIVVLADTEKHPIISLFNIHNTTIIDYTLQLRLLKCGQNPNIIVVGIDKENKLYKVKHFIETHTADCGAW